MHIHENAEEINGFTKIWVDTKTCRAQPSGAVSTHRYTTWHDRGEQQKLEKQWGGPVQSGQAQWTIQQFYVRKAFAYGKSYNIL